MYPKRLIRLQPRAKPARTLVIHSTNCRCSFPSLDQDTKNFQTDQIFVSNVALDKEKDTIYHYIIEKIKDDYYVIVGRPMSSPYMGFNIDGGMFDAGIHVCLIGDYNVIKPDARLYSILAYRVICPIMYTFGIPLSAIKLHSDVSKDGEGCPGSFFDLNVLMNFIKMYKVS